VQHALTRVDDVTLDWVVVPSASGSRFSLRVWTARPAQLQEQGRGARGVVSPTSKVGTTRAGGTRRWVTARRCRSSACIRRTPTYHHRASNLGYPPSALASQAPRRRWM